MEESLEERITALESNMRDALASSIALDMVVRSIIATHPEPGVLADVIQGLLKQRVSQLRDVGFDKGYKPSTAKGAIAEMAGYVEMWTFVCRAAQVDD